MKELNEIKIKAGWVWLTTGGSCKADYKDCDFQQYFNRDPDGDMNMVLYEDEVHELYDQLKNLIFNTPIGTIKKGQKSLEEFD